MIELHLENYTFIICRFVIMFVFMNSFWGKYQDRVSFRSAVQSFQIIPNRWISFSANAFILGELVAFLCLLAGNSFAIAGLTISLTLLIFFTIALIINIYWGQEVRCNCFGSDSQIITKFDVIRNILLIIFCLSGIYLGRIASEPLEVLIGVYFLLALIAFNISLFLINFGIFSEVLSDKFLT